jgi:predicted ATP-dependent serine protease
VQVEVDFFEGFRKLLAHHNIVSISGKSGIGKTTLSLQLIGNLLTKNEPYKDTCIWIQAGEKFPLKRLTQMFENNPQKLEYIVNNIYTLPQKGLIHTYEEQSSIIEKILNPSFIEPPYLKYLVIDNISHHLRYKITHFNTPQHVSLLLDRFYETQVMPLILFCKQNKIILILIHEVTYSPKDECIRPFFYKLYDRIKTIDIILKNSVVDIEKSLTIGFENSLWSFSYILLHCGIVLV